MYLPAGGVLYTMCFCIKLVPLQAATLGMGCAAAVAGQYGFTFYF